MKGKILLLFFIVIAFTDCQNNGEPTTLNSKSILVNDVLKTVTEHNIIIMQRAFPLAPVTAHTQYMNIGRSVERTWSY